MNKTILVVGSSRGMGAEVTKYFSNSGYRVIGVSRRFSDNCEWIEADISRSEGIGKIEGVLGCPYRSYQSNFKESLINK